MKIMILPPATVGSGIPNICKPYDSFTPPGAINSSLWDESLVVGDGATGFVHGGASYISYSASDVMEVECVTTYLGWGRVVVKSNDGVAWRGFRARMQISASSGPLHNFVVGLGFFEPDAEAPFLNRGEPQSGNVPLIMWETLHPDGANDNGEWRYSDDRVDVVYGDEHNFTYSRDVYYDFKFFVDNDNIGYFYIDDVLTTAVELKEGYDWGWDYFTICIAPTDNSTVRVYVDELCRYEW